jgi:hypothetical protein
MSVRVLINRGNRAKPDQHGHVIKLFSSYFKSSYFSYSPLPTSFPVSHKGAHIHWNKVLRAHPGIGRFMWHSVSEVLGSYGWPSWIPPDSSMAGLVVNESLPLTPVEEVSRAEFSIWVSDHSPAPARVMVCQVWVAGTHACRVYAGVLTYRKLERWYSRLVFPCTGVCSWDSVHAPVPAYIKKGA